MFFRRMPNDVEVLVGDKTSLAGDLSTDGTVMVKGKVTGNIKGKVVVLGKGAEVIGDITAGRVVISGRTDGTVTADDIVEVTPSGRIVGDIHTRVLSVAEGGMFEGKSFIHKEQNKIIDFPEKP